MNSGLVIVETQRANRRLFELVNLKGRQQRFMLDPRLWDPGKR